MLLGGGHAKGTLRRLGGACYGPSLPRRPHSTVRPRRHTVRNALGPDQLDALSTGLQHLQHLLTLAYEPVVLPCSSLNCGDVMHRSTLDPVLRMEQQGVNPLGLGMLGAALAYLSVKPGVLMGALDYYLLARLQRMSAKAYSKDDFVLGKKLASGGFGTVYLAELVDPDTRERRKVVVKKAKEFGEAEVWMNERMMRVAPNAAAEFITGFSDGDAKEGEPLWLVWAYEGDCTLADLIQKKDFPTAAEPLLFGRPLNIPPGPERKAAVIRLILQQLLECLAACHAVGIVHRDVKPQNLILSSVGQLKLIDFGAAADLRIGINYVPNQYLLDMRYAPPQQYIMSKYTPRAPSKPLAALLSPVLWNLFHPDRFDMYSVGITLLQMACPNLRNDNGLIAFNKQLADQYNYDLRRWRRAVEASPKLARDWAEGFAILDCDGGAGWDLACQLVQYEPVHRLSCEQALSHRWFATTGMASLASVASNLTAQVTQLTRLEHLTTNGRLADIRRLADVEASWLEQRLAPAGTKKGGGLTEAFLEEELSDHPAREEPPMTEYPSNTIAWWQGRQSALQRRLGQRKLQLAAGLARLGRTIAGGGAGAGAHLASNGSWKGQANNGGGGGGGSRAVNGVNGNGKGSLGKLAAAGANGGSNGLANGGGNGNGAGAGGNRNGAGGKVRVQLQKKNAKDLIGAKR